MSSRRSSEKPLSDFDVRRFVSADLDGVIELCRAEGWESYFADRARTLRALTGPGVITIVATQEQEICGFAQMLSDGAIRAYLANIAVAAKWRGIGIGRRLIDELFAEARPLYVDLLATEPAGAFYDALPHRRLPGYRIYDRSLC
jgi:ribosomal protein S18 acetylase RimI-like enzyme